MTAPKITFIGAGSTIFVKNILGDVFHREALKSAHVALMDIDETRLEESHIVVRKLMDSAGASGRITCHTNQKAALQDADSWWSPSDWRLRTLHRDRFEVVSVMAWNRRSPIRWGRAALCARCGPSRICGGFAKT